MSEPIRLLIVEDVEDDAILLVRELRRGGFEVTWERVQTAEALRDALEESSWDAIVSDYRMPGFDAPAALSVLKESGLDLPFIVVSGTIGDTSAVELMKAGAHDFLIKGKLARLPEVLRRELREAENRAATLRADRELRRTRERLELALEGAAIGTWDWDIRTGAVQIDDRYAEILGRTRKDLEPMSVETFREQTHPEDLPGLFKQLDSHFRGETPRHEWEFRMRHRSGRWVWVLARGKVVERDAGGKPLRMAGTHLDITDRKQAERESQLQNAILERIARLDPLPDILDALVRAVETQFEGGIGSILLCDRSGKLRHGAAPNLPDPYSKALDGLLVGPQAGSCGTAAFCREIVIVADISGDPLWQDFRHLALEHGLQACWSAPAIGGNGEVLATFAVYFKECRTPQRRDLEILTRAADIAKIAIERDRAETALAKRDRYLGALVDVQRQLLVSQKIDRHLYRHILNLLGAVTEADRIYIFENHADETGQLLMSQRAEWCAPGITPEIDNRALQNLSYRENFPRWEELLKVGGIVNGDVADFPESERRILEPQGIRSILIFPLIVNREFFGLVGFDNCRSVKRWDALEIGLLNAAAAAIAQAKERERAAESLAELNRELEARVWERTAQLRESEEKLQAILNFAPSVIYVKDLSGRHILVNRAFLELFNCAPEDIIGKTNREFYPPDIAEGFEQNDRAVLEARRFQQCEETVRVGEKNYTFLSNKFVLFGPDGEPYAICGISNDISERRAFQDALERSEARTRATLMAIPDLVFRLDRSGRYADIAPSPRVGNLVDPETAIGRSVEELLPPDIAATYLRIAETALATQTVQNFEWEIEIGGELRHEEVRVAPCGEDEVLFLVRDVGSEKRAFKALRQSEARFGRLAANIPGALYQYLLRPDGSHEFIYMSDRAAEIFGLDVETMRRDADRVFALFDPEDRRSLQASIARSAETLSAWSWEGQFTTPAGERKWIQGISQPERQADGETIWDGVILDVTERKHRSALLQQTVAELARATRLKDEFLASMSHELRTPLNSILGMSEALQEEIFGELNADQRQAISTVDSSGRHLLSLINDILDLSKIEAGKLELNIDEVSIRELCQTGLTFVRQLAFKKRIALSADIPADLEYGVIEIDNRRMCQVLINLLSNAIKFTPDGGRVSLSVRRSSDGPRRICFAVTDTGIGIAPENLENLFRPFVQIDSSLNRQYSGTGLGLALVKQIAELHGGQVGVTSELGRGSCFTVYLPCPDSFAEPRQSFDAGSPTSVLEGPAGSPTPPVPNSRRPSPLILLAEDSEANIFTLSSYLTAKGYRLITARNGREAVSMARSHCPDLVLMDIQMPVVDGLEATREIRRDPDLRQLPVVALTALAMTSDREKCLQAGADEYLTKPIKLKQLSHLLLKLLGDFGV
ncbi:response regulator [Lyngbya sp. CCY1209]|uniref:response regulator n=1 Tax=Lyngbya sp. CCY1209 TaxID=2886103 RepID=UPI002D215585|nr:response regulator [Lyngbya sp. CCY1209]MEB3885435.1 response regulator [Lyngbya sp. CCY1209]